MRPRGTAVAATSRGNNGCGVVNEVTGNGAGRGLKERKKIKKKNNEKKKKKKRPTRILRFYYSRKPIR